MLLKRLHEQTGTGDVQTIDNNSLDYETESETILNMSKGVIEGDSQDIVILYENMDTDTKDTTAIGPKPRPSNQYVETIVYNDETDSECSDVSDIYTKEDFHELCMINNETIDFINNIPSIVNPLCHKHSNIKLKSSEFARDHRKQFLFQNPYIENQFKSFNIFSSAIPTSLIDYTCCKRIDDDYNFYMDNLISYIQYTIEQLKRISNGEYLTDKAKQKWRETKVFEEKERKHVNKTVISNTLTNPLKAHNKSQSCNISKKFSTHSEINFRFFNKILEKKIVLEVPKLISGSFTLFGKLCNNKLIIGCKKDHPTNNKEEESQMIVALDLKYPNLPLTNENSKLSLQALSNMEGKEVCETDLLALEYDKCYSNKSECKTSVEELEDQGIERNEINLKILNDSLQGKPGSDYDGNDNTNLDGITDVCKISIESFKESFTSIQTEEKFSLEDNLTLKDNIINTNTLTCALQRLNTRSPVQEEIEGNYKKKNRSPTRVRIKSPYENKSYILDEKKRKRLLEIREKREKRKIAMSKNSKISKNKYGQGSIFPQASSSVTKLSITNKSFYNSIYGHTNNTDNKEQKHNTKKRKNDLIISWDSENYVENLGTNSFILGSSQDNSLNDYFKSSETQAQSEEDEEKTLESTDLEDAKFGAYTTSTIITPGDVVLQSSQQKKIHPKELDENIDVDRPQCVENLVPANTQVNLREHESPKSMLPIECRKSIDKLYNLIKELKPDTKAMRSDSMYSSAEMLNVQKSEDSIVSSVSLNGSNVNSFSNQSNYSVGTFSPKNNKNKAEIINNIALVSAVPKSQTVKFDEQNIKNHRKHFTSRQLTSNHISDNPLKAISQLIHKFDNVQRLNRKSGYEPKANKKLDEINKDDKSNLPRLVPPKIPRLDKLVKNTSDIKDNRVLTPKEKKSSVTKDQSQKILNRYKSPEAKNTDKVNEKKIEDLIDEVKEMRGEAVRGPKQTRLDSLAQPKKLHFDQLNKEHGTNYGKSSMINRFHRNSQIPQRIHNMSTLNNKQKKTSDPKSPQSQTTKSKSQDETITNRRSPSNSPDRRRLPEKKKNMLSNINSSVFLKKKPVDESHPKHHFEQTSNYLKDAKLAQKSRVPVIPDDFTSKTSSLSADDSNSIGKKLHCMVNEVINVSQSCLTDVDEIDESFSQLSKSDNMEASQSKSDDILSISDFPIDVFEDKYIVTAVASTSYSKNTNFDSHVKNKENNQSVKFKERSSSSLTELENINKSLTGNFAGDTFDNKLRIKNVTPEHSKQQIFVLQSGDASSVVMKSIIPQKICNTDFYPEIISVENLSKSFIDCCCKTIPLQCFPVLQSMQYCNPVRNLILKKYDDTSDMVTGFKTSGKDVIENKQTVMIYNGANEETRKQKKDSSDVPVSSYNMKYHSGIPVHNKDAIMSNHSKFQTGPENDVDTNVTDVTDQVKNMSNTTSMDILVGLLNEIKNITTYESNINSLRTEKNEENFRNIHQEDGLENSYQKQISITALDKLRKLESNSSMYSYFNSSNEEITNIRNEIIINSSEGSINNVNNYNDKSANIAGNEIVDRCTNIPSQLLVATVKQSTVSLPVDTNINVVGIESRECRHVTKRDKQCFVTYFNSEAFNFKEVTKTETADINDQSKIHGLNKTYGKRVDVKDYCIHNDVSTERNIFLKCTEVDNKINSSLDETIDSQLKLKRDILVTVYSMLVLTVFVALTFPNIIFHLI